MARREHATTQETPGQAPADADADTLGPTEPLAVAELVALMRDFPALWWIAGGWAIDLFLGRQTRPHHDLDLQILRRD